MRFKDFVVLQEQKLNEGGNAIKSSSRINQENVAATLENIYKTLLFGIKFAYLLNNISKKCPLYKLMNIYANQKN